MAFLKQIEVLGFTIPDAYHRVVTVAQNRLGQSNDVVVHVYPDANAARTYAVELRHFPYENINGDVLEWAYTQLKTLPEFDGVVDV